MRVAYLAAGAANMYCGSCLRDNRLALTLRAQGHDVILLPLYTPLRSDEATIADPRVHFGGINVYLHSRLPWLARLPGFLTRAFDSPWLLRTVGRFSGATRAADLGKLTLAVLAGGHGPMRREITRLVDALRALGPSVVNLPNLLFGGVAAEIKARLGVPVVCTLSGEDLFVDQLIEPFRGRAFELIRRQAADIDRYVAVTEYYAEHCTTHFGLPRRAIDVVPLGIAARDFHPAPPQTGGPFTIGYLARIAPEKGFEQACRALIELRRRGHDCRLRAAGFLGPGDRAYYDRAIAAVRHAGVAEHVEYLGEVTREQKIDFLRSLHALTVPTHYREAKGLYVLEALAAGVPVVQPDHGSFPELVEATGGGLLYPPGELTAHCDALERLIRDPAMRAQFAERGHRAVRERFTDEAMARRHWAVYERVLAGRIASESIAASKPAAAGAPIP